MKRILLKLAGYGVHIPVLAMLPWAFVPLSYGWVAACAALSFAVVGICVLMQWKVVYYLRAEYEFAMISATSFNYWWTFNYRIEQIKNRVRDWSESRKRGFRLPTVRHLEPIPPNSNPFHYDISNMGTPLVRGWTVMHPGFDSKENPLPLNYVILVNCRTGQRIHVKLEN